MVLWPDSKEGNEEGTVKRDLDMNEHIGLPQSDVDRTPYGGATALAESWTFTSAWSLDLNSRFYLGIRGLRERQQMKNEIN